MKLFYNPFPTAQKMVLVRTIGFCVLLLFRLPVVDTAQAKPYPFSATAEPTTSTPATSANDETGSIDPPTTPACSMSVIASIGTCQPATNTYSVSGTVVATNSIAQVLTITDGAKSTTVSIGGSTTTAAYSLTGLVSGTNSHTLTVATASTSCAPLSNTYTAPASCSVTPVCSVSIAAVPSLTINQGQPVTLTASGASNYSWSSGQSTTAITVSPASTTAYSVTGTTGICTSTTSVIVTVSTTATTPASQTVCRSSGVVLTASGAGTSFEWYKNGQSAPFKLTEIASIQKGTKTASLTVVSIQTTASYYCKVIAANGGFSFEGPFKVTVNYGCIAPGARVASLSNEAEGSLSVILAPNPVADGRLRAVVIGANGQLLRVTLTNLRGEEVNEQAWPSADSEQVVEWDVSHRPAGVYLLRAQTNQAYQVVKVVKP